MAKNIIITGSGKGIGRATATLLSKENNILLTSRTEKDLVSLKESLLKNGNKIEYFVSDLNKEEGRIGLYEFALKHLSPIDVLINNAGAYYKKRLFEAEVNKIDEIMDTNIKSMIKLTQLFAQYFLSRKKGQIINISSVCGLEGFEGNTIYCASKFAVTGFTKALFEDLRTHNIRVTAIYPDFVNTWSEKQSRALLKPEDIATVIKTVIDLPDYAVVQDLRITAIDKFKQVW